MDREPEWYADEFASGDTDRVNDAIDRIDAGETTERVDGYGDLLDACRPVYESDDGYVRQAVVRFLRESYPLLEIRIGTSTEDSVDGYSIDDLTDHRHRLVEFLLRALDDEDGRVRRAAVDGIRLLATGMAFAELDAERLALVEALEAKMARSPESKKKHVEEARHSVAGGPGLPDPFSGFAGPREAIDPDDRS